MNLDLRASGLLALLLIVLAACDVFRPSIATAQELGPIKLTEKVQNFIAAHQEMARAVRWVDAEGRGLAIHRQQALGNIYDYSARASSTGFGLISCLRCKGSVWDFARAVGRTPPLCSAAGTRLHWK